MANCRKMTGYQDLHLSQSPRILLSTHRPINDEIFSSLRYLSEIDEVGYDFIRLNGFKTKRKIKTTYSLFQAFIRQGKTFFESAESLEYRAQPLFYYYSFLNLAKAYLCIRNPSIFNKNNKLYHGLVHNHKKTIFTDQTIKTDNGVFKYLYEQLTENPIKKGTTLNISSLFGYIPEIGYEHSLAEYGAMKTLVGKSKIVSNESEGHWPLLAIHINDELFKNVKYFERIFSSFDQIDMPKKFANEIFNINAASMNQFVFLQGKKTYKEGPSGNILSIALETINIVKNCVKPMDIKTEYDFYIFMPLKRNMQIDFNDILASYVIMYYLGSLVRYHPEYLESLLNSKHAWMIENFTKSVTNSFLRNINNLIHEKFLIYYQN